MSSISEKKFLAKVRVIHAEQISLYEFHHFKKKQMTQLENKQVKQNILK